MAATAGAGLVIARYSPVRAVLGPSLLILFCAVFMAAPYLHPGGPEGFIDEYRRGLSYYVISLILGPVGIAMGVLIGYRIIAERRVAVRYRDGVFYFTQAMMVAVPAEDLLSVEPSPKKPAWNLVLTLRDETEKTIYGAFFDRSPYEISNQIRQLVGLPPLDTPPPETEEPAYSPERIKPRRSRGRVEPQAPSGS